MKRSLSCLLLFLLCLFIICCAAQASADLLITVRDAVDNTTIPSAAVSVNGVQFATTNNNGQVLIPNTGSDHRVRISMNGYDDWENIIASNQSTAFINMSRKKVALKVSLYDSDTLAPIPGALVNISGMGGYAQSGQSDASGVVAFTVNATMVYSLDISAPHYESRSGTADVAMEDKNVQFWLLSGNKFSFVVNDKDTKAPVKGAEVRLNDISAGTTDERGILSIPLTRGKEYTIAITRDGYEPFNEIKTISESDALYKAEISKAPLGAFVYVYDENHGPVTGAEVYINGSLSGTTDQFGRSTFPDLVFGAYPVEVRKIGFVSASQTIVVSNKSGQYSFILPFENSALTISVQDKDAKSLSNATVSLDGTSVGRTDDNGMLVTKVRFGQLYNITAARDGYLPASIQKQVVEGNATASATITLDKSLDWGLIGSLVIIVIAILVLFAAFRRFGRRPGHHVTRRNEI